LTTSKRLGKDRGARSRGQNSADDLTEAPFAVLEHMNIHCRPCLKKFFFAVRLKWVVWSPKDRKDIGAYEFGPLAEIIRKIAIPSVVAAGENMGGAIQDRLP
jgi:hypothetical protein